VRGESHQELINNMQMTLKKHFNFLDNIGMVINKSKTEITLFGKEYICLEVNIGNINIKTQENMKMLGLTFSHKP